MNSTTSLPPFLERSVRINQLDSVSPLAKLLLFTLNSYTSGKDVQPECWPSWDELQIATNLSRSALACAMREVREAGLVLVRRRSTRNIYTLALGLEDLTYLRARRARRRDELAAVRLPNSAGACAVRQTDSKDSTPSEGLEFKASSIPHLDEVSHLLNPTQRGAVIAGQIDLTLYNGRLIAVPRATWAVPIANSINFDLCPVSLENLPSHLP